MYELLDINQNLLYDFYKILEKNLNTNKIIIIKKAIENAVRHELPNSSQFIIDPIIKKAMESINKSRRIKIKPLSNKNEGIQLFEKYFENELSFADTPECSKEFRDLVDMSYDLVKYDKKFIYEGKEYLYNVNYLLHIYRQHNKAEQKWLKLKNNKPDEQNINISLNTNTTLEKQLSFLNPEYARHKNNPFAQDIIKDIELKIINEFKDDNHMMARSIWAINELKFDIDSISKKDVKSNHIIKSFKNLKHTLDSDIPISRKDIINSWLTHIAFLYTKINPQSIPKTKLSEYINIVAKATTIYKLNNKTNVFSVEQLRQANFREIKIFNGLRLIEIVDNRKKITKTEQAIIETERYIKNITSYLHKHGI